MSVHHDYPEISAKARPLKEKIRGVESRLSDGRQVEPPQGPTQANSPQQRVEEALRLGEDHFREAFEHAPIGMVLADLEGRFQEVNGEYCRITGYSREELLSPDFDFQRLTHPEDWKDNLERFNQFLRGSLPVFFVEKRYLRKDGSMVWVRASAIMRRDLAARPFQIVGLAEDITERKRLEGDLYRREQEYKALLENNPDIIVRLDKDLRRVYANLAWERLTGLPVRDYLEKSIREPFLKDRLEVLALLESACLRVFETGQEDQIEFAHSTSKGQGYFHTRVVPERGKDGKIETILTITRDITELKRAQEDLRRAKEEVELRVQERTAELEQKNRELQDFAFIASHDLREPLRKIQAFGDLVMARTRGSKDELEHDYIRRMQSAAARMRVLLDSLLTYSRLSTQGKSLAKINPAELIQTAISDLEIRIRETGASVEIGDLPPQVEGDDSQLVQVFENLLGNALKFHKDGEPPQIRIYSRFIENTATGGGEHEIYVEDNGIGFDAKYLDKIFLPFQRLHGRSEYEGVGMGLAICRKIVEGHGGTITARSTPGRGSVFIVRLPGSQTQGERKSQKENE